MCREKYPIIWRITWTYASQRMSYPVANHVKVRVIQNILRDGNVFLTKNVLSCGRSCKGARHEKYFTWKIIREHTRHKKSPIL